MLRKIIITVFCLFATANLFAQKKSNPLFMSDLTNVDFSNPDLSIPQSMMTELPFEKWLGADNASLMGEDLLMRISDLLSQYDVIINRLHLLSVVHPDTEVRSKARDVAMQLTAHEVKAWCKYAMYLKIVKLSSDEKMRKMSNDKIALLNKYVSFYNRNKFYEGTGRDQANTKLFTEFTSLQDAFIHTIATTVDTLPVNSKILPFIANKKSFIEKYPNNLLPLTKANYLWLMSVCTNEDVRKLIYMSFHNRCNEVNGKNAKALSLFQNKIAVASGFKNYRDYHKMGDETANDPFLVTEAINSINRVTEAKLNNLLNFKQPNNGKLFPWDVDFVMRAKAVGVVETELTAMEFATTESVIKGLMKFAEETSGIVFSPAKNQKAWASDVAYYEINHEGKNLGTLYFDVYERQGKADVNESFLLNANLASGTKEKPCVALVLNFPRLTGTEIMLTASQTELIAGKFGEALHLLIAPTVSYPLQQYEPPSLAYHVFSEMVYNPTVLTYFMKEPTSSVTEKTFIRWKDMRKIKSLFNFTEAAYFYSLQENASGFDHQPSLDELAAVLPSSPVFNADEMPGYMFSNADLFTYDFYKTMGENIVISNFIYGALGEKEITDKENGNRLFEKILRTSTVESPWSISNRITTTPTRSPLYLQKMVEGE